jgi:hypothetical protein
MRWTWVGLYILPVIMYAVYAWINPDGVGFGKTYNACYVISTRNRCLSKQEADALGGGFNVSMFWQIVLLIGFCYSLIFMSCLCYCNYHQSIFGMSGYIMPDCMYTICWSILLIVMRSIHAGRVVSGDLCAKGNPCDAS